MSALNDENRRNIVVLDTETTGLDKNTDRVISFGAVKMDSFYNVIQTFEMYFNPGVPVSPGAQKVHGISDSFLASFSPFCATTVTDIIQDAVLVMHNAQFDVAFLNKELQLCDRPALSNQIICTLELARKLFPGSPNNLDAVCARYNISTKHRQKHGALLDAVLVAQLLPHLMGQGVIKLSLTKETAPTQLSKKLLEVPESELEEHNKLKSLIQK